MKLIDFEGFCGPTYLAQSPVLDAQRSQNLYPEPGIGTSKSRMALWGRPGLSSTGFNLVLGSAPVRQLWAGNNRLFAVSGTHFYELSAAGGVTTDYGAMAGSTGTGFAQASANGTQLLVMDSSAGKIYNANTVGPAMNAVFNGVALEYLDGYYVAIATGASLVGVNPNQINVSNFLDGTTWNALNYVLRTGAADLTTQLAVLNGQLWIFGQKSIECWYNAGNANFPFARIQGADINLGLIAPASVVKFYNTIMWLGADDRGYAQVYMTQGLNPVRVSNFAVEQLIGLSASLLPRARAFGYQEAGHTFYVLNLMSQFEVPFATIAYDLTTGLWHERVYAGSWPVCFASVPGFNANGPNFVGDGLSGRVCFQGINFPSDLGASITYTRTAPHLADRNVWTKYPYFELDGDLGSSQPILDYSNDGGRTFNGFNYPLQKAADQGAPGTFRRFYARQLGRSRDRVFRVTVQSSADLQRWTGAFVGVGEGNP